MVLLHPGVTYPQVEGGGSEKGNTPPRSTSIAEPESDRDNVPYGPTGPPATYGPAGSEINGHSVPSGPTGLPVAYHFDSQAYTEWHGHSV